MSPVEALELALAKENESIEAYRAFLVQFPATKDIFQFLLNEEEKHKQMIQKKITEIKSY